MDYHLPVDTPWLAAFGPLPSIGTGTARTGDMMLIEPC